jgi:hypothetical protein
MIATNCGAFAGTDFGALRQVPLIRGAAVQLLMLVFLSTQGIAQSTETYTFPGSSTQTLFTVANVNNQSTTVSVGVSHDVRGARRAAALRAAHSPRPLPGLPVCSGNGTMRPRDGNRRFTSQKVGPGSNQLDCCGKSNT